MKAIDAIIGGIITAILFVIIFVTGGSKTGTNGGAEAAQIIKASGNETTSVIQSLTGQG